MLKGPPYLLTNAGYLWREEKLHGTQETAALYTSLCTCEVHVYILMPIFFFWLGNSIFLKPEV